MGVTKVKKYDSQSSTSIHAGKMLSNMGMQIEETEVLCRGGEGFGGSTWVSYGSPYRVNEELQTPVACFVTGNRAILLKISPGEMLYLNEKFDFSVSFWFEWSFL